MKKHVVSLVAFFFLCSVTLLAQDGEKKHAEPKFKKTKSYSKSYALSGNDRVSLNNQFGEMKINTWTKNEVKVDVTITGKSDEEARAQEIMDRISIEDKKDGSGVSFKTKFENEKSSKTEKKEHRNEGMNVDYTVYLPAGANLKAVNHFGPMTVPDLSGPVELESKFGSLNAGKLSNSKSVRVEFGKADIAQVSGGDLEIKFSEGRVNKASGDLKSDFEFSQVKIDLDNDLRSLDLKNSYSSVYLDLEKNFSASWSVRTSHGEFSNKTSFGINEEGGDDKGYGPRFTKNYKGTSGAGAAKINIQSSFGEVVAGHDLQVDFSKKSKNKGNRHGSSNRVI
jgi:hypothetical protein